MFKDFREIVLYILKKVITSRLFVIGILIVCMFGSLIFKLYDLQIVKNDYYQENYTQLTRKSVTSQATRGMIYDRNGKLLAYNELTYSVVFTDSGALETGFAKNEMLIRLLKLLDEHGETIVTSFPMAFDTNGNIVFTTSSQSEKNVLLQNIYGISKDELDVADEDGVVEYSSNPDPKEFYEYALHKFGIGYNQKGYGTDSETTYEIDPETALELLNIRYSMYLMSYMKYESISIAEDLSLETVTEIKERASEFPDISIEENTDRVYNYATYFAHIIGYTGVASDSDLEELQAEDSSYTAGDIVGRAGLEKTLELTLSGQKSSETLYLDSEGRIMEETDQVESVAGDNVYLTLDADLQMAVYYILEEKLAGILIDRIVNEDVDVDSFENTSNILIPVKDAYFQLINNNVLTLSHFSSADASEPEQAMYQAFLGRLSLVSSQLTALFQQHDTTVYNNQTDAIQDYYDCLYDYMISRGYLTITSEIRSDDVYTRWSKGTIGLPELIEYALNHDWIDVSAISSADKYATASDLYELFTGQLIQDMQTNTAFAKLIYKYLIQDESITGREVCLALFYQGVLSWSDSDVQMLMNGGSATAYAFLISKIENMEITPAQLALDPCTASCTVIDVKTGEPLAVVTYPGYDNNLFSGSVDATYYNSLLNDLSKPLYNNATQTRTAPGSTFKLVTATAGLMENVITTDETIEDLGIFEKQGLKLKCWTYPVTHGAINVISAIRESCNYFFSEVGYRLSLDENGNYNENLGLEKIYKYASLYGLDKTTGIEITELDPQISDYSPVPSSIGQGTHAYANIQLARYITSIANEGTVYQLTLLKERTDYLGQVLEEYSSQVDHQIELPDSVWDVLEAGTRAVVTDHSYGIFDNCAVQAAGKTGTAEESKNRAPHSLFVSYAPYDDPEISVTVVIPHGYTSTNAQECAELVYDYYYGAIDLNSIVNGTASPVTGGVSTTD